MTRKKWNRLRRSRPEMFGWLPSWEGMNESERNRLAHYSNSQCIAIVTGFKLAHYDGGPIGSGIMLIKTRSKLLGSIIETEIGEDRALFHPVVDSAFQP